MSTLVLGNPAGLWALLAIPAVLAIHFLQPRSRRLVATTLFLIEHLPPLATTGRAWRWLRSTWALWLQLLAAFLLTWLLAEPRWLRRDSIQTIVVLVDASASMRAFRTEAVAALASRTPAWARAAARTEWIFRETDLARPVLYRGFDRSAALAALERWQPDLGSHDFAPALDVARQLVRRNGAALLLTDRRPAVKLDGVALLAVGRAVENAGFAGGSVEPVPGGRPRWTILLQHHGSAPAVRSLETAILVFNDQPAPGATRIEEITLEPGGLLTLTGEFPEGVAALEFRLTADAFGPDDVLPLVVPVPRPLTWRAIGPEPATAFFRRFLERTPGATRAPSGSAPDISIYATNTPFNQPVSGAKLIVLMIYTTNATGERVVTTPVVADLHPWIDGVTWSGLLGPGPAANLLPTGARALLWQGEQPLAWLEAVQGAPRLVFGWNWPASNAERLPASAVLLHRVIEDARRRKFAPEARNVDAGQLLGLPFATSPTTGADSTAEAWTLRVSGGMAREIASDELATLRAPAMPGFFEVRRGEEVMLRAGAQFADPRETNFSAAETLAEPADLALDVTEANSDRDHLRPLWLLLLLGVLLGSWAAQGPRRPGEAA
jgi:hypothetical protein